MIDQTGRQVSQNSAILVHQVKDWLFLADNQATISTGISGESADSCGKTGSSSDLSAVLYHY
jgi:hypothetical protein